jgi:hypothetical protein
VLRTPVLLSLSSDNTYLRGIESALAGHSVRLRPSRPQVEASVASHLGYPTLDEPVAKKSRPEGTNTEMGPHARNLLLRALIREQIIKGKLRD